MKKKLSNFEKHKQFLPFNKAREFVHTIGIKRQIEWFKYCKSGQKPEFIPRNPDVTYKNKGWKNYSDWLGSGYIRAADRKFKTFLEARDYTSSLNLKNVKDWRKFTKSGKKPDDIPAWPPDPYGKKGWTNWGDFLGSGVISSRKRQYLPFEEARKFVHSLQLKGKPYWEKYRSKELPSNIPVTPDRVYKNEWKGWTDWTTGNLGPRDRRKQYLSYEEAKKFIKKLKLKSRQEWRQYSKSNKRPSFIPTTPEKIYKNDWVSMGDWLGTEYVSNLIKSQNWLPWKEAKIEYRKLAKKFGIKKRDDWRIFIKTHEFPKRLPKDPVAVYSKENVLRRMKKK